jgi:hypothetical protein
MNKYDIFISYSRKDFDEVNAFVNILQKQIPTLTYWFDITGIESGDEFEDKIISAINNSSYVLFALSENSILSKWTKDEVIYAKNIGKKVIPILLKGGKFNEGWFLFKFGRIDCIDSTNPIQVEKLINNLLTWTCKKRLHTSSESTSSFQIPQHFGSTIMVDQGDYISKKIYNLGKEVIEKRIDTDNEKNITAELKQRKGLPKRKVLYFSIIAMLAITIALIFNLTNSPNNDKMDIAENMVDLGLPSGTIWRTCNLGATDQYEQGLLYTWGSVIPINQQPIPGHESYENIIGTSYDAASIVLGSQWRLPSEMQVVELIGNCKWEWQDEHSGYLITGPNGNTMFLPAAGCVIGNGIKYEKQFGYYWTGESSSANNFAKELLFGRGQINIESGRKNVGRSIRAVYCTDMHIQ